MFKVTKITPATKQTLEQSKEGIRQLLISQKQQKELDKFTTSFRSKWRSETDCAKAFVIPDCSQRRGASARQALGTGPAGTLRRRLAAGARRRPGRTPPRRRWRGPPARRRRRRRLGGRSGAGAAALSPRRIAGAGNRRRTGRDSPAERPAASAPQQVARRSRAAPRRERAAGAALPQGGAPERR